MNHIHSSLPSFSFVSYRCKGAYLAIYFKPNVLLNTYAIIVLLLFKLYRGGGGVTRKVCILGQKTKSEFFKTDSLQAFFKMLTHRGKIIFLQKKGLYEACSIPHSELSKVTLQIIFYF